jgi:Lipocalin-like domain
MILQTIKKYKKLTTLTAFAILLLTSCADTKNNKIIIGRWRGVQWESNGKALERNVETTSFTFTDKGTYTFENNGNLEAGTYKVEVDNLFTTPKDQQEMMVKITKLTGDSLVFDMNRSGMAETLILIKK